MSDYAAVRCDHYLNELCLTHLLWEWLCAEHGSADEAEAHLIDHKPSKKGVVTAVKLRLAEYGENSVSSGPSEPYPSDATYRLVNDHVRRAFDMDRK